jgi:hypothetical protein
MVCARHRDALSDLAAGGETSAPLNEHLATCAGCSAELVVLRQILAIADQELARLSVAEPSLQFVSRVRAAAAASRERSLPRPRGLWLSLATAAAMVLAIILVVAQRPAPQTTAVIEKPSVRASASLPVQEAAPDPVVSAPEDGAPSAAHHRSTSHSKRAEPQVLVPRAESRALVQWLALVNRERRSPDLLDATEKIDIKPIEIVPLDSVANSGT